MTDDADDPLAHFAGTARLFPLPNLVLFPGVVQGLHVFEPRYRRMTADALAGDGLIALALLKPGWEPLYEGAPSIEPVACLGRIDWHEKLDDGRYNLRLRGVARVEVVEEFPGEQPYRTARVELIAETAPDGIEELKALRRGLAEAVLPRFADDGPAARQLRDLFDGEMTLGQLSDVLAYALPLPVEVKQALLAEPHAGLRAATIADALRVSAARADREFPPGFSPN